MPYLVGTLEFHRSDESVCFLGDGWIPSRLSHPVNVRLSPCCGHPHQAAGMIAKECGVPTLLWGPRDVR